MPTKTNAKLTPNEQSLESVYAGLNANDIASVIRQFDTQIVRIEPEGFPAAGIYRGHDEVRAHFVKGRETWAEGTCEPERFIVSGDKIVVFVHVHVRLKGSEEWIEGRLADGFVFKGGKAIEMRTFAQKKEALDWAGVSDQGLL